MIGRLATGLLIVSLATSALTLGGGHAAAQDREPEFTRAEFLALVSANSLRYTGPTTVYFDPEPSSRLSEVVTGQRISPADIASAVRGKLQVRSTEDAIECTMESMPDEPERGEIEVCRVREDGQIVAWRDLVRTEDGAKLYSTLTVSQDRWQPYYILDQLVEGIYIARGTQWQFKESSIPTSPPADFNPPFPPDSASPSQGRR